jgi:hydroxyethylthiazole kinase-like uncharacterized protein yjeF
MKNINGDVLKKIYTSRPKESHKYDFGNVLIVGGSQLYSGSPALAAIAAMRAGADLTFVLAPERAANIVASFSPDLISFPLKGDVLSSYHLQNLNSCTNIAQNVSRGKVSVVIGGGLGRREETQQVIRSYLLELNIPAVIDADAIWAISKKRDILKGKKFILTPHSYEFSVLSGRDVSNLSLKDKAKLVKDFSREIKTVILLKGNTDIISDGKEIFLNKTGCPEMTVGGTGDTLAGICGCFLAQKFDLITTASAAAYLNGKAGELASRDLGVGLLATDLIEYIPRIIR